MKLSELQQICKNLAKLSDNDPEIAFRIEGSFLELEGATVEGVTEVDMTRGALKPVPKWDNKVVFVLSEGKAPYV